PVLLLVVVAAVLVAAKAFHLLDHLESLKIWIQSLGPWGPVVFVFIYIAAVVFALPATVFTFLAGVLFGTVTGVIVVNLGATVGACLAFLVGRYFARGAVERVVGKHKNFKKLDEWTSKNGVWIVIITRLVPLLPFNLLNYAFGLTRIRFWPYAFWSWLCMIPATIVYVGGADAVHQGLAQGKVPWPLISVIGVMVALLALLGPTLKKKVKL
ncbi:MAG TPA: TVP38/TMEM64 family protein, partial [bacterium]|nr:TVP38/TMEM64 family protein [bacterium]